MDERQGRRSLAAILFTDVAGFSKVAALDESRALELLHRDFDLMRQICSKHGGSVMNVMGDGLLMMFGSAVDAMECALEIQNSVREAAKALPPDRVLQHRIGVHLGDVILEHDNVLGDGVNVASRLQAEARPGAICFSRTVYDVVKNKIPLSATYLGPRALKNIPERVMVWQTVPEGVKEGEDPVDPFADLAFADPGSSSLKTASLVGGVLGLVACATLFIVGIRYAINHGSTSLHAPTNSPGAQRPLRPPPPGLSVETPKDVPKAAGTDVALLRATYDFAGVAAAMKGSGAEAQPNGPATIQRYETLAAMKNWLQDSLSQVPQTSPLKANIDLGSGEVPCTIYAGQNGLVADAGSVPQLLNLWSLPPHSVLNVATAAAQAAGAPSMAPEWIRVFSQEYGLSI